MGQTIGVLHRPAEHLLRCSISTPWDMGRSSGVAKDGANVAGQHVNCVSRCRRGRRRPSLSRHHAMGRLG
jgi:hypothetical protein